jgi:hypothetical protein
MEIKMKNKLNLKPKFLDEKNRFFCFLNPAGEVPSRTTHSLLISQRKTAGLFILFLFLFCNISFADDSKAILTIVYEARGESLEGQISVASVIKTRAYIKGKTSEEIVIAPNQFSCWKNGKPTQKHIPTSKEIETAWKAWNLSVIGDYTNYYATSVHPYWSKSCTITKRIGRHIFCHLDNF